MPSKSAKQHRLMAMVANDPKAAKRLDIPQSVGKDYMKADKRKGKKFALGGPTSYSGEDSGEGMKMSTRRSGSSGDMSFKDAFRAARKAGDDTFTWKGKKYTTEVAGAKKSEAPKVEAPKVEVEKKTETKVEVPAGPRRTAGGRGAKLPEGYKPKVGSGRFDDPTSSYGERVLSPLKKLTDIFGRREEERVMRNMGVSREEARKRIDAKEDAEEGMRHGGKVKKMRGGGMPDLTGDGKITRADVLKGRGVFKHGGGVKRYASGGSVSSASKRADGIAKKGKTRGKIC
jgi:hypothetical protein